MGSLGFFERNIQKEKSKRKYVLSLTRLSAATTETNYTILSTSDYAKAKTDMGMLLERE